MQNELVAWATGHRTPRSARLLALKCLCISCEYLSAFFLISCKKKHLNYDHTN